MQRLRSFFYKTILLGFLMSPLSYAGQYGINAGGTYLWANQTVETLGTKIKGSFSAPIAGLHALHEIGIVRLRTHVDYQYYKLNSTATVGTGSFANSIDISLLSLLTFSYIKLGAIYIGAGGGVGHQLKDRWGFFPLLGGCIGFQMGRMFLDTRVVADTNTSSPTPLLISTQLGWTIF